MTATNTYKDQNKMSCKNSSDKNVFGISPNMSVLMVMTEQALGAFQL